MERMNAVVQGLVLRRMKNDLGLNGKELVRSGLVCYTLQIWGGGRV